MMHSRQKGPWAQMVTTAFSVASMHTGHSLATPMASFCSRSFFFAAVSVPAEPIHVDSINQLSGLLCLAALCCTTSSGC